MEEQDILRLVSAQLQGTISTDDLARLRQWYESSEENRRQYRDYCLLLRSASMEQARHLFVNSQNSSWRRVRRMIHPQRGTVRMAILRYAAVVAIAFVVGWMAKQALFSPTALGDVAISVPTDSRSHVTLPDGSTVWLNAGSHLSYSSDFGEKERRLTLDGEGFFEVAHDSSHPFVITSGNTSVRVLGTKFDLKAYRGDPCKRVTLLEGSLRVEQADGQRQTLKPGEQVVITHDRMQLSKVAAADYVAWTASDTRQQPQGTKQDGALPTMVQPNSQSRQSLIFDNEPLEQIVCDLGRAFNVEIHIEGDISGEVFYGDFRNGESLRQILDIIASTSDINYRIRDGKVTIYK